jgi:hypothetical protein
VFSDNSGVTVGQRLYAVDGKQHLLLPARRSQMLRSPLSAALYESLVVDFPPEHAFPDADDSAVVLAVEEPWLTEVRRLVTDQEQLARLYTGDSD